MPRIIFYLALSFVLLITYKSGTFNFPINEVRVISSETHYDENKLNKYIKSLYGKDLLVSNIDTIQTNIMKDQHIRYAEIKKSFPSTLEITIYHHKPIAKYDDKIMTSNGSLIDYSKNKANLPLIIDHDDDPASAKKILLFSIEQLDKIKLKINKIEIFHSLVRIYANSLILTSDTSNFKKNINRLILSFDEINRVYGKEITSIDMRYSNGFAIK